MSSACVCVVRQVKMFATVGVFQTDRAAIPLSLLLYACMQMISGICITPHGACKNILPQFIDIPVLNLIQDIPDPLGW